MKIFLRAVALGAVLAAGLVPARADDGLKRLQQSLRDQGFYYGPVDGSTGDETTQAVRRYQIRNGLPVTGQIDDETRRSIEKTGREVTAGGGGGGGSTRPTVRPVPPTVDGNAAGAATPRPAPRSTVPPPANPNYQRPTVRPVPAADDRRDGARDDGGTDEQEPPPARGLGPVPRPDAGDGYSRPDLRVRPEDAPGSGLGGAMPRNAVLPSERLSVLFASTPYEFAPPPVQADILRRAQGMLARQGFYDGPVNGVPTGSTEDALADYQGVNHLRKTGRLDVGTLGNLRLLPGRQRLGAPARRGEDGGGPNIIFEGRIAH